VTDPVTVNTGAANPIYVNIGSLELDGYDPFTGLQAKFTRALTAGYAYTLVINFQKTDFAWSNIYWVSTGGNDGYLTFDKGSSGHEFYQGVFFKWGSLVGVSPNPSDDSDAYGSFTSTTPIYKPTSETTFTKTTVAGWANVPHMTIPSYADYGNYVLNQGNNWSAGTGDICNFIDDDYRLPNKGDFDPANSVDNSAVGHPDNFNWDSFNPNTTPIVGGWRRIGGGSWSSVLSTNNEGTFMLEVGASMQEATFPAAGNRFDGGLYDGIRISTGWVGLYLTGSSCKAYQESSFYIQGGYSRINAANISPFITSSSIGYYHAGSVRCVKN
jgi:hypothetical protein